MKDTLKKVEFFTFYDKTGIEKHLEQMAAEGWLLEKMSAFHWTYRRIEPKKIHFSVSYYATVTDFEPEPTEQQQAFNEFCEHSGWKLATQTVQMQIFYNENDDPVPIETDPMLEIENIHISVKKTVLVSYILMLFLGFMMGASFVSTMLGDPILLLSSSIRLFTGVWCIVAFIYSLTELITYLTWRRKAKKLAEQGVFLETRGKEDSIILGQYRSSQHPNTYEHSPTMQYTITEVKMPFLYDFVADQLYHQYDEWRGYDSVYEYVETDATAWGADKAWQLYKDGKADTAFLVCYDKYILEISVDWELTAEQMQIICEKVNSN